MFVCLPRTQLWLHCHHLLASFVTSCPLLPSSSSSSTHFHTLNRGFRVGTHSEILSPPSSFLKGIIGHCSIYSPMSVCLCFPVSQLWIALSERLPGAREAPDPSLLRISTSTPRDSPADDYHRIQNEISTCSEVEIRGRRRERQLDRKKRKPEMRGCKTGIEGVKSLLCGIFELDKQKSQACLLLCGSLEMKGMCLKRKKGHLVVWRSV